MRAPSRAPVTRVIRHDGSSVSMMEVRETAEGTFKCVHGPYEFAADVCQYVAPGLYFVAVSEVALRSEADFHQTRKRIAFRALWSNQGDVIEWLRNAGVAVCFGINLMLWARVGDVASAVASVQAALKVTGH